MKRLFAALLSGVLLFTPFVSYASDELYYAQNGEIGRSDNGMTIYYLTSSDGYAQSIELYLLVDDICADYKVDYRFSGYSDYDPDLETKKSPDMFSMVINPSYSDKISAWDNSAGIYRMDVGVTPGEYSLLAWSGPQDYNVRIIPITPGFEDVKSLTLNDTEDDRLWFRVGKDEVKRVYAIYYAIGPEYEEDAFYEEHIDSYLEWAIEEEKKYRANKEESLEKISGGEEISVSISEEEAGDKVSEIMESFEPAKVEIVEGPEEPSVEKPKKSKAPEVIPFVIGISAVVVVILFAVIRVKVRRNKS